MPTQAKDRQVEPNPSERLLKMSPERLLVEKAEASQIGETGPTPQRKHRPEQLLEKLALPEADPVVVNVSHQLLGSQGLPVHYDTEAYENDRETPTRLGRI
ncbi:hypothetical protein [Salinibacter ruber]|uniref:hypothetical protein n=1 Tax=Salinibacter ruber TaxID=146919 RepID=UPI002169548F|nr:hypothetical protein [Salinibacter ruber]MCS4199827.1 hypothetical protein [Salinibacter ruber]